MGRRLALRKGLAVSAAVLLLLGWALLFAFSRAPNSTPLPAVSVESETTVASSSRPPPSSAKPLIQKTFPPLNLSVFPPHPKSHPPSPAMAGRQQSHPPSSAVAGHQQNNYRLNLQQCQFSEAAQVTDVDVQVTGDCTCSAV